MGLGLSVSNMICMELKGSIFLEWTKPKKGSKFSFFIPVRTVEEYSSPSLDHTYFSQVVLSDENETYRLEEYKQ